ncbi:MAG: TonB-dependent receptor plug domain-containing protein [bacterium]|nr:TonB-dependent receptor plug domain-containing protein [bacterium]
MSIKSFLVLFIGIFLMSFSLVYAQEIEEPAAPVEGAEESIVAEEEELSFYSLEEALNMEVTVASKKGASVRESPGIISVVTREEIMNSGARDLNDVLLMVPGFVPAAEISNIQGLGLRGMYTMEGKMLVLVDGVQVNEMLYGNPVSFGQFFVDQVERIEIIRGPGSALYGGFAELAVINIITRNADMKGVSASVSHGQMVDTYGRRKASANFGDRYAGVGVSLNAAIGQGHVSDRKFTAYDTVAYSLDKYGENESWFVNVGVDYEDLIVRFIGNHYGQDGVVHYNTKPMEKTFSTYIVDTKYSLKLLKDKLSITPRVTYSNFATWVADNSEAEEYSKYYKIPTWQVKGNLTISYDITKNINIIAGGEFAYDKAIGLDKVMTVWKTDLENGNKDSISFYTHSYFVECMAKTPIVNFTAGARYDHHNKVGGAFVPRAGLTKAFGDFHFKALFSRAYRTPTLMNIDYEPAIEPEFTTTFEVEAGYIITKSMFITVNVFDTRIKDAIIYFWNSSSDYGYRNQGQTGTQGFDVEYRIRDKWGYINLAYSFYRVNTNTVSNYQAKDTSGNSVDDVLLGFPAHKASLNASIKIIGGLSINPSGFFLSKRYVSANTNHTLDNVFIANLYLQYKDLFVKGLSIGAGVFNIINTDYDVAPGYYNWDQQVPGQTREFTGRVSYEHKL